jgi:hypothetical protein
MRLSGGAGIALVVGCTLGCSGDPLQLAASAAAADAPQQGGLEVGNTPPAAFISYPADAVTFYAHQRVNLRGYAYDPDEEIAAAAHSWSSSRAGPLFTGADGWVTLSAGAHAITLTVRDRHGALGRATITVDVEPTAGYPSARIKSPGDFAAFPLGQAITLVGEGIDPEDGAIPSEQLAWFSDVDGFLGTGTSVTKALSGRSCAPVYHLITLVVTDAQGHQATHQVTVLVGLVC